MEFLTVSDSNLAVLKVAVRFRSNNLPEISRNNENLTLQEPKQAINVSLDLNMELAVM